MKWGRCSEICRFTSKTDVKGREEVINSHVFTISSLANPATNENHGAALVGSLLTVSLYATPSIVLARIRSENGSVGVISALPCLALPVIISTTERQMR